MINHSHQAPSLHKKAFAVLVLFFLLFAGLFSVIWAKQITLGVLPVRASFGFTGMLPLSKSNVVKENGNTYVVCFNPGRMNISSKNSNSGLLLTNEKGSCDFTQNGTRHLRVIWNKSSYTNTTSLQNKHKINTID